MKTKSNSPHHHCIVLNIHMQFIIDVSLNVMMRLLGYFQSKSLRDTTFPAAICDQQLKADLFLLCNMLFVADAGVRTHQKIWSLSGFNA